MVRRAAGSGGDWIESLGLGQNPAHLYSLRILSTQMSLLWGTERHSDLCWSWSQPGLSAKLRSLKAKRKGGWRRGCLQMDGRSAEESAGRKIPAVENPREAREREKVTETRIRELFSPLERCDRKWKIGVW